MAEFVESNFLMSDGVLLSGLVVKGSIPPQSIVLHLHANSYTNVIYTSYGRCLSQSDNVVCLLNLRGNGASGGLKGRVDYTGQLEDDVQQVILQLAESYPEVPIVLSGHSGGTAICLRYADRYKFNEIAGLILMAPIIQPNPEASRYDMPGTWFLKLFKRAGGGSRSMPKNKRNQLPKIFVGRIILAWIFPFLRNINTVSFPRNGDLHEGRTFDFSYKTMKNYFISNYAAVFSRISGPVFISIGSDDDVTLPSFINSISDEYISSDSKSECHILDDVNHINVVRKSQRKVASWLVNATVGHN